MNDDAYSDAAVVKALLVDMELPDDLSNKKPEGSIPFKIATRRVPIQDIIIKAALEQYDIAIIKLDIENPDTVIATISELQNTYHLPVVLISQVYSNTILRQIQLFPSVVFLLIPFSSEELYNAIQQILQKHASLSTVFLRTPSELSLAESRYQLLLQSSIDGFMLIDLNGKILDVNDAYLTATGYTAEEVYRRGLIELEAIDTPEDITLRIKKIVTNGFDRFESRHKCSDGTLVDFEIKIVYKANEQHLLCFFNTITERKRIEQTQLSLLHGSFLNKNENYFQSLARFIAENLEFDYICIDKLDGNLLQANTLAVYYNGNFEDNVQYTLHDTPCGEVVGNTICCFPGNVRHLFPKDAILQDMAAESYIGATLWDSSGSPIGLIAVIGKKPIKNQELNETLLKLIAIRAAGELERELAETELRQSETQYRRLIETMQEGILEVDNDDVIVFANPKFCSMLGYQKEELLGKVGSDYLLTPTDKEKILQKNRERQSGKSEQYTIEMIKKSGDKILLLLNATPVFSNGIVSGSFATCLDITDSKKTEEQLLTSEARYRSITENAFDMIALVDLQGKYLFCNKSFYDIMGYTAEETIGRLCFDLVVPEERKTLQENFHQSLTSGIHEAHVSVKVTCKNGSVKLLDQKARLLVDEEKTPDKVLLIAQDITEKTQSENIFRARNAILEFAPPHSLFEVLQKTLDEAELLTNSKIGFYHFLLEDQETLSPQAWSTNTIANMCNAKDRGMLSKVSEAGVWAECVLTRFPVIHNNYSALTNKKGMPEGHADVIRELVVPVFRENKIVALLGVGNKLTEYNDDDVKLLSQFADTTWDIAENKIAEDSLRKSETRYRDISRLSTDFAYSCIHTGERYVVDWISDAFYSITGFSEDDLMRNKCWLFTAHDDDRQKIIQILINLNIGDTSEDEFRLVDKKGCIHYIVNKMECVEEPAGATGKRVFGAVQDITFRKLAEDALRESKEKYRRLSEATFEAIFITEQGVCVEQNLTAEKMFGYSSEEALGRHATDWIIPEDREKVKDKILSGYEEPYEAMALRKDGSTFPCMLRGRKMNYNGKLVRVTSLSDITEQKNAEEALLESEEIFSQFLKHSPVFVTIKDEKGRAIRLSSNFSQMLHKPLSDIIYKDMEELFPGSLGKQMKSEDMQVLQDGKRLILEEHFNGRDYTTIKFPIVHKGKTLYLAGYTIDITERLQAELKLRENEERLRMIIEHSPVAIGFSSDGITTGANPAYLKLFGYTHVEQIIGKSLLDQIAPPCRADILANIKKRAAGEPVEQSYETTGLRADGSEFPFWASLNRILFADGPLTLAFIIDLSVLKQHEELLRESEEKYRGLVQGSPDAIAIYIAGKVVFTNNASLKLMRASSIDDLIGMNVLDFVHPDSRELVKSRMLKMMVDGKELPVAEEKFIRLDGTVVDVEVRAIPVVFDKRAGVQLIVRDISERKKREDEIAILSRAVEQSPASIIITDLDGNIEYVNAKSIETSGYSKEEIIGKNPRIVNSGVLPKSIYEQLWKTISTGIEWRGELANKKKNGELYWEFVSISPIKDTSGKFSHYLAIKEDITERKELEKSLIDAKLKAEAANNLKDAFIANISHEIRTPLNGILGMTSIIESIFADSTGPDEKLFFSSIDTSSRRLMNTVDKILNFSRLQVGEFPMRPARFSVSAILEEIIKEYLPLANKKALKLVPVFSAADDTVYADQASITNAFANLMDNAVKFTVAGQISVTVYRNEKNELSVEFRDNGIGISDEYIANLFAPYTQEQSGFGRAYEGVGLGLSITKRILDLNGAGISVWSRKDKGSIFTVTFNKQSTTESEAITIERNGVRTISTAAKTTIQPEAKPSILVVEDDGINQVYIRSILKNKFNVFLAADAKKALDLFAEEQFAVILMDISLKKGLNGLEITQLIRNGNRNKHTPIIAVTGHAFPEDMKRSLEAGCNEYLSKPFSETDLLLKISPFVDK